MLQVGNTAKLLSLLGKWWQNLGFLGSYPVFPYIYIYIHIYIHNIYICIFGPTQENPTCFPDYWSHNEWEFPRTPGYSGSTRPLNSAVDQLSRGSRRGMWKLQQLSLGFPFLGESKQNMGFLWLFITTCGAQKKSLGKKKYQLEISNLAELLLWAIKTIWVSSRQHHDPDCSLRVL